MLVSLFGDLLGNGSLGYPGKLPLVLLLGVALLAKSSSVHLLIGVLTLRRPVRTAVAVIATIAHATGVVLGIGVAAPCHYGCGLTLAHTLEVSRLWMELSLYGFRIITEVEKALKKFQFLHFHFSS